MTLETLQLNLHLFFGFGTMITLWAVHVSGFACRSDASISNSDYIWGTLTLPNENGNERDELNDNPTLLPLFQFLILLISHVSLHVLTYLLFSSCAPDIAFNFPPYVSHLLHISLISFLLFLLSSHSLSSCLPSLQELSNNRSLDNLDCIEGTGLSLPRWDDDELSQACSTLGRRSCMGQVSAALETLIPLCCMCVHDPADAK